MSKPPSVNDGLIENVIALSTREEQSALLSASGLLNPSGLSQLLDAAAGLVRSDPGKARRLAALSAEVAAPAGAPLAVPRATYIAAQAHAINGELETALELITSAHDGFAALGENGEALRTNVGRMHVLNEMGRHQEALEAGQAVLASRDRADGSAADLLTALVHQNRGVCYRLMGRYEEALDAYAEAEAYYAVLGMREHIGHVQNNRGVVLLNLGRAGEALAAFESAAATFAEADRAVLRAQALINIGDAHLLLGDYALCLDALEQARRLLGSLDALADKHILLLDTADAYLALNLYPEALAAYRQAERLLESAGMAHHRARALMGLGSALIAQSQLEEAGPALAEAAGLFAAADNVPLRCSVMLEQAALQAARGDVQAAVATAHQALALVTVQWPVQLTYAHFRLADLLLPDTAQAEPHLSEAQRQCDALALPHLRYRLNARLGHLRLLQRRDDEAERLLRAAVDDIERLRGTLAHEAVRASFLRDKVTAYEDLVQVYLARGDEASQRSAFAVAEQARSRALVDLLAGVVKPRRAVPADARGAVRLERLQADLNAVYNELLANTRLPELQPRAVKLEQEISRLRLQASPGAAAPDPLADPLSLDAIQAHLPPDVILLAYQTLGDEIMAFASVQDRLHVVRGLSTVPKVHELLQRLAAKWERFRAGRRFVERHMALLERSARRLLASLYSELVAPLEGLLPEVTAQAQGLAVVPHGLLHQVPFHALFDGERYLIDRCEVSYAPSATALALCQRRLRQSTGKALVLGVPDPLIPAVEAEARSVARHLVGAQLHVGEAATQAALEAGAPDCDVVHLACHGLFRADNPMFSALKLHDRWLTAADVLRLDLPGALVTLSACESGRSQVLAGDEIIGLARAFLGAGAATLVVSLWLVQDETTAELMAGWYELLRTGASPATTLRQAQLALKARFAHPYYWAPFMLVGRR